MSRRRLGLSISVDLLDTLVSSSSFDIEVPESRGAISHTPQPRRSFLKKATTLAAVVQGVYLVIEKFIPLWDKYSGHKIPRDLP